MTRYTLGLDLGSNSVGWAMVAHGRDAFAEGGRIICGVRIFAEGVDRTQKGTEQPRGQNRREKRGLRRMTYRRRQRRRLLARILKEVGLLPLAEQELAGVRAMDPYGLRAKGLDDPLAPYEFGRVLMHLCQRRGFKSNRKTGKSKDDGKVAKATTSLAEEMQRTGCRTLGELLHRRGREFVRTDPAARRMRSQYTLRSMYEAEFGALWAKQSESIPVLHSPDLRAKVEHAIFHQRPLRYDPNLVGDCELEPGEKRCPKAHWLGQQFRMLQEINALRLMDPGEGERPLASAWVEAIRRVLKDAGEGERPLTSAERTRLAEALAGEKKMTFDDVRKCLGLLEAQQFNLEGGGKRDYIQGNAVEAALRSRPLAKWYDAAPPAVREKVYDALAEVETEEELIAMAPPWGMSPDQARHLARLSLPERYFSVSLKAISKMLPYLDPAHICDDRCRRLCPQTPPGAGHVVSDAKALAGYGVVKPSAALDSLPPLNRTHKYLANPLVRRALSEMRKVVNGLAREYGKPQEIVVELAREMKKPREERERLHFENIERKKENEEIAAVLTADFGILTPKRDDILKYRLWRECKASAYSGNPISKTQLFSAEVQIDHILPYSRSLEDSYMNKVLCFTSENAEKGNRTPLEAFAHDQARYQRILQAAAGLPYPKRRRFVQKDIDLDKYIERQLNDTRYISREAVRYLGLLGADVRCARGDATAELRWQWGLAGLWPNADERQRDHRRHAVDAVVVALTTRSALQKLSTVKYNPLRPRFDPPWENFRNDVDDAMKAVNVSFRPARKLSGALHEDTGLGPVEPAAGRYVCRVPLDRLTLGMIPQIRDKAVRELVEERCRQKGLDPQGKGTDKPGKVLTDPPVCMPSGVPVKRVRIEKTQKTAIPIRKVAGRAVKYVLPGGNHHVEIYQEKNGTWTGRCVSRFEAHERVRRGQAVVDRQPTGGRKFVMSLCINDTVLITDEQTGEARLYRLQKVTAFGSMLDMLLRFHAAAQIDDKSTALRVTSWTTLAALKPQKVVVDPIGRVLPCND